MKKYPSGEIHDLIVALVGAYEGLFGKPPPENLTLSEIFQAVEKTLAEKE